MKTTNAYKVVKNEREFSSQYFTFDGIKYKPLIDDKIVWDTDGTHIYLKHLCPDKEGLFFYKNISWVDEIPSEKCPFCNIIFPDKRKIRVCIELQKLAK